MFPASSPKAKSSTRLLSLPCIISTCGGAESRRPGDQGDFGLAEHVAAANDRIELLSFRLPRLVFLFLQLRLNLPAFASQFFFEFFDLLKIAGTRRCRDLVFQRDFALDDLGFVFRFMFSDLFLLSFV